MKINHLDLFSGIGGFHLGFEKAGFEVNSYFSEIDKYAIDVYKNNFKNSTYVGSVTDVRAEQLPKIDAITFGSPCQDFSLAGKRKGMGGDRSSLITEAIRLIDECRPRFFIWENVKGTFSSNNGEDFWAIIQAFTNIGGYRLEWQLLNTKWFLPQNRERIYLVGYLGNGSGGQVFPIRETTRQNIKPSKKQDNKSLIKIKSVIGYSRDSKGKVTSYHKKDEANTLHSSSGSGGNTDQYIYNYGQKSLNETLEKENLSKDQVKALDLYNKKAKDDCPTLTEPHHNSLRLYEKGLIRRLTPIECERLQGFPDNWTQYGESGKISDTQRYKMCGNAVTVDVVEAVAKNIIKVIK
jgi:DNA (cytosine-5)-methyltransferase 1